MKFELDPDVEPIAFLLGTWRGEGEGDYPTTRPFRYREETRFWHVGEPYLLYSQSTWSLEDESPVHFELGFWRARADGSLDVSLAYPLGVVEVAEGRATGTRIHLVSRTIGTAAAGSEVRRLDRTIEVKGDELTYELQMEAVGEPLSRHLTARLAHV